MNASDVGERRRRSRLILPARSTCHDDDVTDRRILDAELRDNVEPIGQANDPRLWRDRADPDLRRNSACHRKHAERCKIDRLDTVIDENSEQHFEPILFQPISSSSLVSRAASAAHNVSSAIPIIMTETPAVPPK